MPTPGLYPMFLKAGSGSSTVVVEGFAVQLELQPTIVLEPDPIIALEDPTLQIVLEPDIDIEVD